MTVDISNNSALGDLYHKDNQTVWEVVGIITTPAAVMRNLSTGRDEVVCINSTQAGEYTSLNCKALR